MTLKVGDRVWVVDAGATYSRYDELAVKLKAEHFESGFLVSNGDVGKIVALGKHPDGTPIALVNFPKHGRECLISVKGLRKFRTYTRKPKDPLLTLKKGDVLESPTYSDIEVLGTESGYNVKLDGWLRKFYSAKQLKEMGYTLKPKKTKVTMAEVAKALKIDVNSFEIVEEV